MKKKCIYTIFLLLVFSFVFACFGYEVQAGEASIPDATSDIDVGKVFRGDNFNIDDTGKTAVGKGESFVAGILNNAIAIVRVIGLGIAIIMLFSLGIKYMTGSIEEKAEVKKHAIVFTLGAVIFFAATAILEIIQMFIQLNFVVE